MQHCDAGRVIVIGSVNIDSTTRVNRLPKPGETVTGSDLTRRAGGKGANQAVSAACAGASVAMISAVGADEGGVVYLQRLIGLGVDVEHIAVVEGQATGHALITVDANGENCIVVIPGANACVSAAAVRQALKQLRVGPGDVVLAVLELPLEAVSAGARAAAAAGARVVSNLAPYARVDEDVLALADPVVVNEQEAAQLAAAGCAVPSQLTTLGSGGAVWNGIRVPGSVVDQREVVDTTGAGDAFCGALAAALAAAGRQGSQANDALRASALRQAVNAGGRAVRHEGAQPSPEL